MAQSAAAGSLSLCTRETNSCNKLYFSLYTRAAIRCTCFPLTDAETAKKALQLVHGYRLSEKPLVVEFGRERQEEEKQKEKEEQEEKK